MSLPELVETLSEIELALIKYQGSKKTMKIIVELSKKTSDLFGFLNLEEYL
jgi:hypothetical protein